MARIATGLAAAKHGNLKQWVASGLCRMSLTFEWHPAKAAENVASHGVSFEEASTCFQDPRSLTIYDPEHSDSEDRYVLLGMSARGSLLVVVHTERGDNIRLVSARVADRRESAQYTQAQ
jgi:hypothetical protein